MLMKKNIAETVRSLVEKPLGDAGFSLWNVRYEKEGKDFVLLVEVDRDGLFRRRRAVDDGGIE